MMLNAKDILAWDTVTWSLCLNLWRNHVAGSNLRCLELGCGPGTVSLWLASQGHSVMCTDLNGPRSEVVELHRARGVSDRLDYRAVDATAMCFEAEFDVVVTKSVLGGIWMHCGQTAVCRVAQGIRRALKPGGKWLFGENLRASAAHMFARRVLLRRAGKEWYYPAIAEMLPLFDGFADLGYKTGGFLGAFGRTEWQRRALGYVDKALVPALPVSWRYLMAGVATR